MDTYTPFPQVPASPQATCARTDNCPSKEIEDGSESDYVEKVNIYSNKKDSSEFV